MLTDLYRKQISPGEINCSPSMVEPSRVYTIGELLARPDLILSSRSGYSEDTYDPEDPSSWEKLHDAEDIPDNFDFEVPRDPDLYNPQRPAKPAPRTRKAKSSTGIVAESAVPTPSTTSKRTEGSQDTGDKEPEKER